MAGYSGTPLIKKLGIKSGFNLALLNFPSNFSGEFTLPPDVTLDPDGVEPLDFAMLFVKREKDLQESFPKYAALLKPGGMLWVSWPKKSSGVQTDLLFTNVQAIGLASGLVDVKVCAVDDVWSGLKFVFRLKDRPKAEEAVTESTLPVAAS